MSLTSDRERQSGGRRQVADVSLTAAAYSQTAGSKHFLEQLLSRGAINAPHITAMQAGPDAAATALANGLICEPPQGEEE